MKRITNYFKRRIQERKEYQEYCRMFTNGFDETRR